MCISLFRCTFLVFLKRKGQVNTEKVRQLFLQLILKSYIILLFSKFIAFYFKPYCYNHCGFLLGFLSTFVFYFKCSHEFCLLFYGEINFMPFERHANASG